MAVKAFLDTNIVLRLLDDSLPEHQAIEAFVNQVHEEAAELWISRQVIREYLVQVTRPGFLAEALNIQQVTTHMKTLQLLFKIADETDDVTRKLLDLIQAFPSGGKQIHDANIVATMLVYGIDTLLTINVADMKRFGTVVQITSPSIQP